MAEKQDFKTKVKGAFGTKAFKSGGYSLLASVIVIVIVFALNMAVGALPANWTKFDMTDTGMFSLSGSDTVYLVASSARTAITNNLNTCYMEASDAE